MNDRRINVLRKIAVAAGSSPIEMAGQEVARRDAANRGLISQPINPWGSGEMRVIRLPGLNGGRPTPVFMPDSVKKHLENYHTKKTAGNLGVYDQPTENARQKIIANSKNTEQPSSNSWNATRKKFYDKFFKKPLLFRDEYRSADPKQRLKLMWKEFTDPANIMMMGGELRGGVCNPTE